MSPRAPIALPVCPSSPERTRPQVPDLSPNHIQRIAVYRMRRKGIAVPYIDITTNASLTPEVIESLKSKIADALAASFPGKTENWLMVRVSAGETMFFAGSPAPCMMVDVAIFGAQSKTGYQKMTAAVCALAGDECGLPADRVYVKYTEYDKWGWNGSNF